MKNVTVISTSLRPGSNSHALAEQFAKGAEAAYHYMVEGRAEGYNVVGKPNPNPANKQLLIIPGATHCDLYDGGVCDRSGANSTKGTGNYIPWDTLADFFTKNL